MKQGKLNCQDIELLMQDYLDGYLLSSQREDLEKHLYLCPSCRRELILMKRLEEQLEGTIPIEVPPGFGALVTSRLPRNILDSIWARRMIRLGGMGLATAFAAILALLFVFSPFTKDAGFHEVEIVFHAPGARSISVAGDFNDWDVESHRMDRGTDGSWRLKMQLAPGLYQYNFYIDDRFWAENPPAPAQVSDGFGGRNALLYVEG